MPPLAATETLKVQCSRQSKSAFSNQAFDTHFDFDRSKFATYELRVEETENDDNHSEGQIS